MTCAHGIGIGYGVLLVPGSGQAVLLGTVLNRRLGGRLDVSFFEMANPNYSCGQAIYYTSSQPGVTRPGAVLDGTMVAVATNNRIYKSGMRTYLTSGLVQDEYYSTYIGDVYFYDLIKADRNMADQGDSGAVTYVMDGASINAKAVGLVKARDVDQKTLFVKAICTKWLFGPEPY